MMYSLICQLYINKTEKTSKRKNKVIKSSGGGESVIYCHNVLTIYPGAWFQE